MAGDLADGAGGCYAYLALAVLLHASGKRTLSKMNAFDLEEGDGRLFPAWRNAAALA